MISSPIIIDTKHTKHLIIFNFKSKEKATKFFLDEIIRTKPNHKIS